MSRSKKQVIREEVHSRIAAMSHGERRREQQTICEAVERLHVWRTAVDVLLYHSLADEVDPSALLRGESDDKVFYLPRVEGQSLRFLKIEPDARSNLVKHQLGMLEPRSGISWTPQRETIAIVPGRAFGSDRSRVGRGGGFYDRFFGALSEDDRASVTIVGICYSVQLFQTVPVHRHDMCMDLVIAGGKIISC